MYIEHPFKYGDVYYAKVDGELIEITREQAKIMLSFYRNYKNYDKKWGYRNEEADDEKAEQKKKKEQEELDSCKELMDELDQEEKEAEKKAAELEAAQEKADQKTDGKKEVEPEKRKLVVPREIMLDCVFSENAFDVSVQDMPGEDPQSTEAVVMKQLEYEELYQNVSKLSEQDQYIINEVFFKGRTQVEVARSMGVTPQNLYSRLKYALIRLRRIYVFGENL